MVERDINFGSSETDAKYQISDDGAPGNFVLARDTNGNTVLLQWNATAGQWEYGGPVDMDGNDLVDAGTTVYDASTDTVGDGTTSADHAAVTTDDGTFNTSITDPSATSHTGELADLADVFSGLHTDLTNVTSDQHHSQTHANPDHTTKMVEDATGDAHVPHEIQINGTDGTGIINFKT